jgi:hypothetical protein
MYEHLASEQDVSCEAEEISAAKDRAYCMQIGILPLSII